MAKQAQTPKELFSLFAKLKGEEQSEFLCLIGGYVTGEAMFEMAECLNDRNKERFLLFFEKQVWDLTYGQVLKRAVVLAKEHPELAERELAMRVHDETMLAFDRHYKEIGELERTRIKEKRDRKPDPEIVERNVRICELRKADPKTWSRKKLARKFEVTERMIGKILAEESNWRQLKGVQGLTGRTAQNRN